PATSSSRPALHSLLQIITRASLSHRGAVARAVHLGCDAFVRSQAGHLSVFASTRWDAFIELAHSISASGERITMKKRWLGQLILGALTSAALLTVAAHASLQNGNNNNQGQNNDNQGNNQNQGNGGPEQGAFARIATGQYITPTEIDGAVQQDLNPHLSAYPDFVAGEAVRSQLSPDGTTLAVITAGQNSLYKPDGTVDTANSTQF